MEPHPVPQNIIDVEFKLFGAFTLKQFGKILIGCLVGVGVYFIPLIPLIVKVPLIFIAIAVGLLMAIIPNFGTWFGGFIKALIVAPRYVWVKEKATPDILKTSEDIKKVPKYEKVSSLKNKKKYALDSIMDTTAENDLGGLDNEESLAEDFLEGDKLRAKNFDDKFESIFNEVSLPTNPLTQPSNEVSNLSETRDYKSEFEKLKFEFSKTTDPGVREELMGKMNDLYHEIKASKESNDVKVNEGNQGKDMVQQSQSDVNVKLGVPIVKSPKVIKGIVVDKSNNPVGNCEVLLISESDKSEVKFKVLDNGKFEYSGELKNGSYDILINHPTLKFHSYRIEVGEKPLPMYKFREK